MLKALLFAAVAAIGNAIFVYGQRRAPVSNNPFVFTTGAVLVCSLMFIVAMLFFRTPADSSYLSANWWSIAISGIGFFITFIGFYLLFSRFGASYYAVYAALAIITTSIGVGVVVLRETFNLYHAGSVVLAILAVAMFAYGQSTVR